jgi:hypothetical protein
MDIVADPLKIMGKIYDALNILPQKKSLKHVEVSVESLQRLSRSEYGYPIDTARVIMKIITVIASWENEVCLLIFFVLACVILLIIKI